MHKEIKEHLEELLRGAEDREELATCREHNASCESCAKEIAEMEAQARMLQLLRSPEELEPDPGFYARVMQKVEARRSAAGPRMTRVDVSHSKATRLPLATRGIQAKFTIA